MSLHHQALIPHSMELLLLKAVVAGELALHLNRFLVLQQVELLKVLQRFQRSLEHCKETSVAQAH
jgi:hypothetical protein